MSPLLLPVLLQSAYFLSMLIFMELARIFMELADSVRLLFPKVCKPLNTSNVQLAQF